MKEMPTVSVIVPVYKVEKYLDRCIKSILSQTYTDWELLLVDDGSPDKSGDICDEYAKRDKRVKVYHIKNSGPGHARNYGLNKASGEWVLFVDSDDYCSITYISDFIREQPEKETLVIQGIQFVDINGNLLYRNHYDNNLYEGNQMLYGINESQLLSYGSPYCKLFNKSIIIERNLMFPEDINFGEDSVFFFRYLKYIHRLILQSETNYFYVRYDSTTLSKVRLRPETTISFARQSVDAINGFDTQNITLAPYSNYLAKLLMSSMTNMFEKNYDRRQRGKVYKDVIELMKEKFSEIRNNTSAKILIWSLEKCPLPLYDAYIWVLYEIKCLKDYVKNISKKSI